MTPKCWITWVLLSGLLWNFVAPGKKTGVDKKLEKCLKNHEKIIFFQDTFNLFISASNPINHSRVHCNGTNKGQRSEQEKKACIVFIKQKDTVEEILKEFFPQMGGKDSSHLLRLSKWYIKNIDTVYVVGGKNCCSTLCDFTASNPLATDCVNAEDDFNPPTVEGSCWVRRVCAKKLCKNPDKEGDLCDKIGINIRYIINLTATTGKCYDCQPSKEKPKKEKKVEEKPLTENGKIDPAAASETMKVMTNIAFTMNETSAALSGGEGVQGIIKKITETEEVSFGYSSPNDHLSIISDSSVLQSFSRSVSVSIEAMDKARSSNLSDPFIAIIRFTNMAQDEKNSTVLGDEVLGVEMGTVIDNLTDPIGINFLNMIYEGIPSCQSWNGDGNLPNWTTDGCETHQNGTDITCQCTHLTFFAILLAPPNQTISSTDLKNLTIITKVGCGLSMFFLCIVLFMHFLIRRTKATDSTKILINLVLALCLLDLLFLINSSVAGMKNAVGCKVVAALMHYSMLATFTWFAVQALHLCIQLYTKGNIVINRYMLKVCLASWLTPSVIVVVLLVLGKYGEQVIQAVDPSENVTMCWINDGNVHYIVNIGYYAIVFILTFTTFTVMLSWLCINKKTKKDDKPVNKTEISLMTVMGLCCMMGVTWGFAFFAYGDLQIPSYYIFTVLNSFQGFFLFIYYYKSRSSRAPKTSESDNSTSASRTTTIGPDLLGLDNPYINVAGK
ncbi:adhesion G-protein coupled receptor G2 isoform X1 [Pleuronectes platessa]|uniref:adhesion G-protein coupled receptor G2 isoform X1 n=1 Tax=Pleuronectes platessa TaxID=8262 RepID=UPI00232A79C8|nr:adhesion G-protein coupled receptor G2 isoform X1 [Pleuronectes platessa]XP_053301626.1 adhesion G-protein coupled receptor G2 isoform X1 [Pleuronectes platessa]